MQFIMEILLHDFHGFAHMNTILGWTSTDEEIAFLNDGADTYGVAKDDNIK